MLKLKPKFDLHRDVVSDVLRKEASVCRVEGEAFRCQRSTAFALFIYRTYTIGQLALTNS